MRFLLHTNQLGERGTETSIYFLGKAMQALGHEVAINYNVSSPANREDVIDHFKKDFRLVSYQNFNPQDEWVAKNFDFAYFQKYGVVDGKTYHGLFSAIHVVFSVYEPHGTTYSYISKELAHTTKTNQFRIEKGLIATESGCINALDFDWVDYIVEMPQTGSDKYTRQDFGIPIDAFVMIRIGGRETFDIEWARNELLNFLEKYEDTYFIAVNTAPFAKHPRIIYLDVVTNLEKKSSILSLANLFVHARHQGESFGMAIVESLQCGTPVIAWSGGIDRNHVFHLSRFNSLYDDETSLRNLLQFHYLNRETNKEKLTQYADNYRATNNIENYFRILWQNLVL